MEIPAIVERVTMRKENGFSLLAVSLNKNSTKYSKEVENTVAPLVNKNWGNITIPMPNLDANINPEGCEYVFIGDINKHPKYGYQFKLEYYYQDKPNSYDSMRSYLMTLPNIGDMRSAEILSKWSMDELVDVLDNTPEALTCIRGLTPERIQVLKKAWDEKKIMRELYEFLIKHNVSHSLAGKIFERWEMNSINVIQKDPYRLTEIKGIGFHLADAIAHKILGQVSLHDRLKACCVYVLNKAYLEKSNLCIPYSQLKRMVESELVNCSYKVDVSKYLSKINEIIKNNAYIFNVLRKKDASTFVYLQSVLKDELYVIYSLKQMVSRKSVYNCTDSDIVWAENDLSAFSNKKISLDTCQKEAIKSCFNNKITIITGGGGTGKSTICRGIYSLASKKSMKVMFMSPTGKAAKVLSDKTSAVAGTVHRVLKIGVGGSETEESLTQDIILIDETSMAGMEIFVAIFNALEENPNANIVFVGDPNQLPSISPGNFLFDFLNGSFANIVKLDNIHRQSKDSYIPVLANEIAKAYPAELAEDASDIKYHYVISSKYEDFLKAFIDWYIKSNDLNDLQVLAPKYAGMAGVDVSNKIIQEKAAVINNSCMFIEHGFRKFYIGDRVIQLNNDYDKNIFNGDIGNVVNVGEKTLDPMLNDKPQKFVVVDFYGEEVIYVEDEIYKDLTLAWACTIHKFQGSQSKNILFSVSAESMRMMSKELVYTAITRAEKMLYIAGDYQMIKLSASRSSISERYTNFNELMESMVLTDDSFILENIDILHNLI